MAQQKIRRIGDTLVVPIPEVIVEKLGLEEGQLVSVDIRPLENNTMLSDELREAFEASWERNEAAYRYLASEGGTSPDTAPAEPGS